MKVREIRAVVGRVAAMHDRIGSTKFAQAFRELGDAMEGADDETVGKFMKRANPKKRVNAKPTVRR